MRKNMRRRGETPQVARVIRFIKADCRESGRDVTPQMSENPEPCSAKALKSIILTFAISERTVQLQSSCRRSARGSRPPNEPLGAPKAWTTVRVRELRERLGITPYDPTSQSTETISADEAAMRLGICIGSVHKLIRKGVLPATQLMPSRSQPKPSRQVNAKSSGAGCHKTQREYQV
jgi:hypothetical protein